MAQGASSTRKRGTDTDGAARTAAAPVPLPEEVRAGARRRVALEAAYPEVDGGRFPAKAIVGDDLRVEVDAFADGHDHVAGVVRWRHERETAWQEAPLAALGNDRWVGHVPITRLGEYRYTFAVWIDHWGTWYADFAKRVLADQDVSVDLQIGARLARDGVARLVGAAAGDGAADAARRLEALASTLEAGGEEAVAVGLDSEVDELMRLAPDRTFQTDYARELRVVADRERARFSAWYERFPRSASPDPARHGTFADVQAELPRIAAMGFDVLYLPPVHPIGRDHRKGPNNNVAAGPDDPGSPWAIGAKEGGHTALHPDLGTPADFRALIGAAREHGIELAMDLAYQCAPDHPWVQEHPEWFRQRPDGTIQYAENPPKKYQDIYPIDFETSDWEALWHGLKGVVDHWVAEGVRIFRVDNPHTKAFPFWEWMIGAVRAEHPEVLFLAEAFTRPKVMARLAKLGFSQSYTYFTWRQQRWEIEEYLRELTSSPSAEIFRPNFWPNTPDILTEQLQHGTRGTYVSRLVLAATASSSYGIYGPAYELMESAPARPGSEEYLDSEKYEVRHRDLDTPDSLVEVITLLNRARREHPALHRTDTLRLHAVDNEELIAYSKATPDGSDVILVVANVQGHERQVGTVHLDLAALGIDSEEEPFTLHDLIGGATYEWRGSSNYVELDPSILPAHVFHVQHRAHRDERDFDGY